MFCLGCDTPPTRARQVFGTTSTRLRHDLDTTPTRLRHDSDPTWTQLQKDLGTTSTGFQSDFDATSTRLRRPHLTSKATDSLCIQLFGPSQPKPSLRHINAMPISGTTQRAQGPNQPVGPGSQLAHSVQLTHWPIGFMGPIGSYRA